jgi:glycosyltransferase involved in cell wall biosynthesis
MKLIIQIPCFNEAETLAVTLGALPRQVAGFKTVEWLVVDDGSTDGTAEIARANGVDHIVSFRTNQGLAKGFVAGLEACVSRGADVIVNTDADNQYDARDIPLLVEPILNGKADIVIGARPIAKIQHFSFIKRQLQELGSRVVRLASRTNVPDAPSGFRAMSREAALRLNVFNDYTYTLETIIQAGQKGMTVASVPIRVNADLRPSRLVQSTLDYVVRSIGTIVRIFAVYRAFRFFMSIGVVLFSTGAIIGIRFLYFFFIGDSDGHVQSLILASILLGMGFQTMVLAFLADLLAVNRRLTEQLLYQKRIAEHRSDH